MTSPFSPTNPVVKNSEIKLPICFGGKLITPIICFPINSSLL